MTTQPISESGMIFGPYAEGCCFHIEKSNTYKSIQNDVQIAEFLLLRQRPGNIPTLWIIEAKSSSPRPETMQRFEEFIQEIKEKMVNAFSLGWAACQQRHPGAATELPTKFSTLDLSKAEVKFILVINGHKPDWLPPLQEALRRTLVATTKTWALGPNAVLAINEQMAQRYGLIFLPAEAV